MLLLLLNLWQPPYKSGGCSFSINIKRKTSEGVPMNKIKIMFFTILSIAMIFSGCNSSEDNKSSQKNLQEADSITDKSENSNLNSKNEIYGGYFFQDGTKILDFDTRYNNIKEKYPDKKVLIWAVDDPMRYEEDFNEYLAEHNKNYVICFKEYSFNEQSDRASNNNGNKTYFEKIQSDLDNNRQIDIITTGSESDDEYSNKYKYMVFKNWLEPLDDYLKNTDKGKALYELMPEKYWESVKQNNRIYGFDGSISCINASVGYTFNSEICDKLKVDVNKFRGSYADSINRIFEICKNNKLTFVPHYLDNISLFYDYDFINNFIYINQNGKAANIYKNKETLEIFKAFENGFSSGVIDDYIDSSSKSFGNFIYSTAGSYTRDNVKTNDFFGVPIGEGKSVPGYSIFPIKFKTIHSAKEGTGICRYSKNKDLAFEAFTDFFENKELSNTLVYGDNYEEKNGYVVKKGIFSPESFDNMLLRVPYNGMQSKYMSQNIKKALQISKISPYCNFCFKTSTVSKQIYKINDIICEISREFPSNSNKSAEKYLKELNKKLYDAGLQDVIDEVNRQLDEFYKQKNK